MDFEKTRPEDVLEGSAHRLEGSRFTTRQNDKLENHSVPENTVGTRGAFTQNFPNSRLFVSPKHEARGRSSLPGQPHPLV